MIVCKTFVSSFNHCIFSKSWRLSLGFTSFHESKASKSKKPTKTSFTIFNANYIVVTLVGYDLHSAIVGDKKT